jgi:hypothetical protein
MNFRPAFLLAAVLALVPLPAAPQKSGTYSIPLPPRPDFSSLDWLVGQWTGSTTGRGQQGEVRFSADYDLGKRFLIFREDFWLPPTQRAPSASEAWVGLLSPDRKGPGFILRMFSNTGFITRYRVTVEDNQVRFTPEGGEDPPPGWLFRRTLERNGESELTMTVQVAPPGRDFFDYFTARLVKRTSPEP